MMWRGRSQELSAVFPLFIFCLSCLLYVHLLPLCSPSFLPISPSGVCIAVYFSILYQTRDVYISSGPLKSSSPLLSSPLLSSPLLSSPLLSSPDGKISAHISGWMRLASFYTLYETSGDNICLLTAVFSRRKLCSLITKPLDCWQYLQLCASSSVDRAWCVWNMSLIPTESQFKVSRVNASLPQLLYLICLISWESWKLDCYLFVQRWRGGLFVSVVLYYGSISQGLTASIQVNRGECCSAEYSQGDCLSWFKFIS